MAASIQVADLVQGYGAHPIIKGLSLEINGGVIGLLGPNGAGKTTLLRTLATVLPPRSGRIHLLGRRLTRDADARAIRRHVGYLPQTFGFYPSFTVYEFVRYCAWLRKAPRLQAHRATMEAIEAVDLADVAGRKMSALSGGMLRRVGIAQALAGDVRLVLLDEPTVGLDPEQRLAFRELIRQVSARATVLLSTHLVEDVAAVCDRLFILSHGTISYSGTPADLARQAADGARGDSDLERGYTTVVKRGRAKVSTT